jgi:hypothetical protein
MAASESVCQAKWDSTDAGESGILKGKAVSPYLEAISMSGKPYNLDADDQLSALEFLTICGDDTFENMAPGYQGGHRSQ